MLAVSHTIENCYTSISSKVFLMSSRCYGQARPFGNEKATQVLSQLDYQSVSEDALLVQLEDHPGALAELLKSCRSEAVTIRNIRLLWRGRRR